MSDDHPGRTCQFRGCETDAVTRVAVPYKNHDHEDDLRFCHQHAQYMYENTAAKPR